VLRHRPIPVIAGVIASALAALTGASAARAGYLSVGTSNTSNATTILTGSSSGAELRVVDTNGGVATSGVLGLLTATSPTFNSTAVRGQNNATNGFGWGVYGSHAGSGTGVYGTSARGIGVYGKHLGATGTAPAVRGESASSAGGAFAVYGLLTSTAPAYTNAAVRGQNNAAGLDGYGVWGSQAGAGTGVYGTSSSGDGVSGFAANGNGVVGSGGDGYGVAGYGNYWPGVYGSSNAEGVVGESPGNDGVVGRTHSSYSAGVSGHNDHAGGAGVLGDNPSGIGVRATATGGTGVYAHAATAGYFWGPVTITGTCTGCTGPSALQIDDPRDPAHKYLQHSSVVSSQQLNIYSGNVTTDAKGFVTVNMPRWFQALNRSFRYQLTSLSGLQQVAVAREMHDNRFTLQSQRPHSKVSWQVTAVRHDRFANAHPIQVVVPKAKKDQGKYLHPEVYGKPRSAGIGYRKPPRLPARAPRNR